MPSFTTTALLVFFLLLIIFVFLCRERFGFQIAMCSLVMHPSPTSLLCKMTSSLTVEIFTEIHLEDRMEQR